ncbi:MAG: acetyltransferase [Bacteroidetes bacterium]|nr:acetyltransferase [Bacteroidota bacterium]
MLENKTAIIGYSGHAYVVAESYMSNGNSLDYYADLREVTYNPFNLEYLGCEYEETFRGWKMGISFILGIGDNIIRERVGSMFTRNSRYINNVIHPNSSISNYAKLGSGVFVSNGVLINAFSEIGNFVILNTGCIIEHECKIDSAAHIAPGAVLSGNVKIGKRSFIGANSVIKQGVIIGDDVIIGAGAVVIKDIKNSCTIVGNPGKLIR